MKVLWDSKDKERPFGFLFNGQEERFLMTDVIDITDFTFPELNLEMLRMLYPDIDTYTLEKSMDHAQRTYLPGCISAWPYVNFI